MSSRAKKKFKRDREDENNPVVQPEVKPKTESCTALSVAKGLVTGPVLTVEIEGEKFVFMVDTGAMISIIQPNISKAQVQPCDIKARGITGTQLDVIGEQEIEFTLQSNEHDRIFVHTFLVSPLLRCSAGILGMDFLQRVGAEISLTAQSLYIGHCSFPLRGQEADVSTVQRLINAGREESFSLDPEEEKVESVGDWEGTVELAESVTD